MSTTPNLPIRPKPRTMSDIGSYHKLYPVVIYEEIPIEEYDYTQLAERNRYYSDNGIYALGRLRGKDLLRFEDMFKMSIDKAVMLWFMVVGYESMRSAGKNVSELGVIHEPENNLYFTSVGELHGSPESNALEMTAFFFSCFGKVVSENEDGTFELESVTMDDMIDVLDYDLLSSVFEIKEGEENEDFNFFTRVLSVVRAFDRKKVEEEQGIKEEDLKNLVPATESGSKPKRTSRTKSGKKQ